LEIDIQKSLDEYNQAEASLDNLTQQQDELLKALTALKETGNYDDFNDFMTASTSYAQFKNGIFTPAFNNKNTKLKEYNSSLKKFNDHVKACNELSDQYNQLIIPCVEELPSSLKNSHIFTIVVFDTKKPSWWREKFTDIECASGRLVQFTGTCWFNTCINIALLSPLLSQLVKKKASELYGPSNPPHELTQFHTLTLKEGFLSLAYRILILKQRIKKEDGDISIDLSIKVKALIYDALSEEDKMSFNKNPDAPEWIYANANANVDKTGGDARMGLQYLLECIGINVFRYNGTDMRVANIMETLKKEKKNDPQVLFIKNYYNTGFEKVMLDNKWRIDAAVLGNTKHAVAGLLCNESQYIFDSNNEIIKSDWREYGKDLNKDKNVLKDPPPRFLVKSFIFVNTDSTTFGGSPEKWYATRKYVKLPNKKIVKLWKSDQYKHFRIKIFKSGKALFVHVPQGSVII
jgi:hypothetical protein